MGTVSRMPIVRYANGTKVVLSPREQLLANYIQRQVNSLGYEVPITTLTTISKKITEQKYFEVTPSEYLPVVVGQGTWTSNITTYRSFNIGANFETGIIDMGQGSARLAAANVAIDALNIKIFNWAFENQWTIFELQEAAKSGNWDLVTQLEIARKTNYDLGVQRIAFLGARGQNAVSGNCLGLLNQAGITVNTSVITAPISSLSTTALKTFCANVIEVYRENCARTAWPTHFVIPESDFNGLASQASPDFPIKSVLQVLEETFQLITRRKDFKILPLAYGDASYHADVPAIAGKQVYALYNYDERSLRMDVPLPYTNTLANSFNNFAFQNVGYSQFTGVLAYRPLEMLYFQYAA